MTGAGSAQSIDAMRIREEAADWVLRLGEADGDPVVASRCREWREADPRHDQAFQLAERAWSRLDQTETAQTGSWRKSETPPADIVEFSRASPRRWLKPLAIGFPAAAAASLAAALFLTSAPLATVETISTPIGETRQIALGDGSLIDVGARSVVDVRVTVDERRAVLEDGQAFFEVAADASRPFVVEAGATEIRVTGTKFDVWRAGEKVRVSVLEGSVEVRRRGSERSAGHPVPAQPLRAGETTTVQAGSVSARPQPVGQAVPGEWRQGRLYYSAAPLAEVIADANRYSARPIRLAGDVGELRVTASFRAAAVDQFLVSLEDGLPVRVTETAAGEMVISAR